MNTELDSIKHELETLKTQMTAAALELQSARQQQLHSTRRARLLGGLAFALVAGTLAISSLKPVGAQGGYGPTLTSLQNQVNALKDKTQFQSADATTKTTRFVGCNVCIQSGSGRTDDNVPNGSSPTGLGNLTIGYNRIKSSFVGNNRTGSHNLILGDQNDYSSYGGLIGGFDNTLSGPYASISTGFFNVASGMGASVSAGSFNTASGDYASISGGQANTAGGKYASISGGQSNTVNGDFASISGGQSSTVNGDFASISGGQYNLASNPYTFVGGGYGNAASGTYASVLGGYGNNASGKYSIVCGGGLNFAGGVNPNGDFTAILGGYANNISAQYGHNP